MQVIALFSQDLKGGEEGRSLLAGTVNILGNQCES